MKQIILFVFWILIFTSCGTVEKNSSSKKSIVDSAGLVKQDSSISKSISDIKIKSVDSSGSKSKDSVHIATTFNQDNITLLFDTAAHNGKANDYTNVRIIDSNGVLSIDPGGRELVGVNVKSTKSKKDSSASNLQAKNNVQKRDSDILNRKDTLNVSRTTSVHVVNEAEANTSSKIVKPPFWFIVTKWIGGILLAGIIFYLFAFCTVKFTFSPPFITIARK